MRVLPLLLACLVLLQACIVSTSVVTSNQTFTAGEGRPDECDDTVPSAHPGYEVAKELWDSYSADSDGVCQSRYGRGVPGPCKHIVQLSVQGNPYYLCWYTQ